MQAFNEKLKRDLLEEVKKHRLAGQLIRGYYGNVADNNFKGCAVGCSLHSYAVLKNIQLDTSNHELYEKYFGIPTILARLKGIFYEGLPQKQAILWPEQFFSAIKPNADLSGVWRKFAIWLLIDKKHGVIKYATNLDCRTAIQQVAELYKNNGTKEQFIEAERDAYAAAYGAYGTYASYAATYGAYAASGATYTASTTPGSGASGAAAAAAYAASGASAYASATYEDKRKVREETYIVQYKKLIALMKECT